MNPENGLWYGPYYGFNYAELHTGHAYPAGHWRVWLEQNHPEGLMLWRKDHALAPPTGAYTSWKNALPAAWHYTHWTGQRTLNWLRNRDPSQPFFLWMSFRGSSSALRASTTVLRYVQSFGHAGSGPAGRRTKQTAALRMGPLRKALWRVQYADRMGWLALRRDRGALLWIDDVYRRCHGQRI